MVNERVERKSCRNFLESPPRLESPPKNFKTVLKARLKIVRSSP